MGASLEIYHPQPATDSRVAAVLDAGACDDWLEMIYDESSGGFAAPDSVDCRTAAEEYAAAVSGDGIDTSESVVAALADYFAAECAAAVAWYQARDAAPPVDWRDVESNLRCGVMDAEPDEDVDNLPDTEYRLALLGAADAIDTMLNA
ncbi:MAG: hypothetical protein IPK81_14060 [Rhodospirillales bacterium]|nr:MAG: hypothetical protein IPK81_14060 [Rhodospirillales bacterium]